MIRPDTDFHIDIYHVNYFYPPSVQSKAVWVLDAIASGDNQYNSADVFWGLGGNNFAAVKSSSNFYFTDMPYWNRWNGSNRETCSWRVIPNALHCNWVKDFPNDRFNKLNIQIKDWRKTGDHILICPSSTTMERFYNEVNWSIDVVQKLKRYTDRPIRIRYKPRNSKTSGPLAATVPFEEDIKNAWAVVTLSSIAGVEAACLGIPVFCSNFSPCAQLGNCDLSQIERPEQGCRSKWLNTLAYYQYTETELKSGILNDPFLLKP